MIVAPATLLDLDAIDAIERHSFPAAWPRATWEAELSRAWAHVDVMRDDAGRVIAFCNYWLVADELHVHSIAVDPDHRGGGVARALLAHVLAAAVAAGAQLATLEVRRSNAPAIALYTRAGFATIHVRAAYYQDGEDALVMTRAL